MRRISVNELKAGQVLSQALFTPSGLKLLPAGTKLSRGRVAVLRRSYSGPLYFAASYAELRSMLTGEGRDRSTGLPAHRGRPVRTEAEQRDADARREWMRQIRRTERDLIEHLEHWSGLDRRIEPALRPIELAEPGRLGWPSAARLAAYRADRVERIALMHHAVLSREPLKTSAPMFIVRELLDLFIGYPDRFARLATVSHTTEHPIAEHALSVAALSVAIAARLGWSVYDTQRAGLAALFADLGMLLEPITTRGSLDEIAVSRLRRHPISSAVMLDSIAEAPEPVRLAVAQHHERLNGSGYPLGARGEEIHDIARVLAVADSFCAAIEPRAHRASRRPHAALVDVSRKAVTGELDRHTTLALIRVVGVFPVGASVALDTGDAAVVISNTAGAPDRPVLRLLGTAAGVCAGELDLSETDGVRITSELAPGEAYRLAA